MLCPRCARREVEPQARDGFCAECTIEPIREQYGGGQRAASIARRRDWSERSQSAWDRDRQRASRLRRTVKPKEPATHEDPYEIAYEALSEMNQLRAIRMRAEQHARLDLIAEALRRLAWGPDDELDTRLHKRGGSIPPDIPPRRERVGVSGGHEPH